jgi:hypothetical protein
MNILISCCYGGLIELLAIHLSGAVGQGHTVYTCRWAGWRRANRRGGTILRARAGVVEDRNGKLGAADRTGLTAMSILARRHPQRGPFPGHGLDMSWGRLVIAGHVGESQMKSGECASIGTGLSGVQCVVVVE